MYSHELCQHFVGTDRIFHILFKTALAIQGVEVRLATQARNAAVLVTPLELNMDEEEFWLHGINMHCGNKVDFKSSRTESGGLNRC